MVTGFIVSLSSLTCNVKHESSLLSPANIKLKSQGGKREQTVLPSRGSGVSFLHLGACPTFAPAGPSNFHSQDTSRLHRSGRQADCASCFLETLPQNVESDAPTRQNPRLKPASWKVPHTWTTLPVFQTPLSLTAGATGE